jgi:gliding motility-associated-like protein
MKHFTIFFLFLTANLIAFGQVSNFTVNGVASNNLDICSGQVLEFVSTSTGVLPNSNYTWNFGTGANPASANGPGPHSVSYSGGANFSANASLTVVNPGGGIGSVSTTVINVTIVNPTPALTMTSAGAGFSVSNQNGTTLFKFCGATGPTTFAFNSTYGAGTTQTFTWGDGTSSTQANMVGNSITHDYPVGQFTLTHTLNFGTCVFTETYAVFNGQSPSIALQGAGSSACLPSPYSINILANDVPINYQVSFSDGSPFQTFSTANDTTVSHVFGTSSCGIDYIPSPLLPPIQNSFSVTVIASNECSANGIPTVASFGPVLISTPPEPQFTFTPSSPVCENEPVTFTNQSTPGENVTTTSCDTTYGFYWDPVQNTGFTLDNGNFGSNNGFIGASLDHLLWTSGTDELEITFTDPGTYQIWLYTANNCGIDSVMQEIVINPEATVIINPPSQTICSSELTDLITMTSTVAGYTINWEVSSQTPNVTGITTTSGSGVSPLTVNPFTASNTSTTSGNFVISATVGCSNVPPTTATITVDPEGIITPDPSELLICSGETTDIDLTSNLSGATFSWTTSGPPTITGESNGTGNNIAQTLTNNGNSMDTLVYTVSIGNLTCPGPDVDIEVVVQPALNFNDTSNDTIVCPQGLITPLTYTTAPPGATISWTNSNNNIGIAGSGNGNIAPWTAPNNNTGSDITGTITITAQLNDCPEITDVFTVTISPTPEFTFTLNPETGLDCFGNPVTIQGSVVPAGSTVSWTGPSIISGGNTPSPVVGDPGDYEITMTSANGCSSTETVNMEPPTDISITNSTVLDVPCFNGSNGGISVQTDNSNNVDYAWTPSLPNEGTVTGLTAGTYSLTVTNDDGCEDNATFIVNEGPIIAITETDSVGSECNESNGSLSVIATGGAGGFSYSWDSGSNSATQNNIDAGIYEVTVTDDAGCSLSAILDLGCNPLIPIVVPQFISPNLDGKNEVWQIQNIEQYPEIQVTVYNRWGNVVYEAQPYNNDWNGHYKGTNAEPLPAATYFWVVDTNKKSQDPYTGYLEIQP